jgi:hypothetical protein
MARTWSNVLSFVKLHLGVPVNELEITDTELVKFFEEHVLSEFSQYSPKDAYVLITASNLKQHVSGAPAYSYTIPLESDDIVDVQEMFSTNNSFQAYQNSNTVVGMSGAMTTIDTLIDSTYADISTFLGPKQTYFFEPPNTVIMDFEITNGTILLCNVVHTSLDTIRPDLYDTVFKKMCVAYTKIWIAAQRSKFENLATPAGQLNLNFADLAAKGEAEYASCIDKLNRLLPDKLLYLI